MVNYYKILGIENYVSIAEIKVAYKDKMRQFHPDLNSSEEATEIAKWLNQAKDVLTNEDSKTAYDLKLKLAYIVEIQRLKEQESNWNPLNIAERRRKMEEKQKLREKEKYLKSTSLFPLKYRLIILGLLSLEGLYLIYNNYFVLFPGYERLYSLLGVALFIASMALLSSQIYTYFWVRSVDNVIKFNYEKWIATLLVGLLLFGPISIYGVNEYRKNYYLNYDYEYYLADILQTSNGKGQLVYIYTVEGKEYAKRKNRRDGFPIVLKNGKILIKYAKKDPRIAEIVVEKFNFH